MRILYGVQATGNGHITRARTMARQLRHSPLDVDYLFSGRDRACLFNMEPFGEYHWRRGLTLVTAKGQVRYFDTWVKNDLTQFIRDVRSLDLTDLVLTDFMTVLINSAKPP